MKKIIDLTQPIYSGMEVYPGDPPVIVKKIFSYKKQGYVISKLFLGNHTGTHIDAPCHMVEGGKTLSDFPIAYFQGKAIRYSKKLPKILNPNNEYQIIIIGQIDVTKKIIDQIISSHFKLVGFGGKCYWRIPLIKMLLTANVLLVGELINLDKLPKMFYFSAFPLFLQDSDGSPVRAIAYL